MTTLIYGCGAQPARPASDARSAPGGLDLRGGGTLTPADLAYGGGPWIATRGGGAQRDAALDIEPFLKPDALARAKPAPAAPAAPRKPARAPRPAKALPPPPGVASEPERIAVAQQSSHAGTPLPPNSDLQRYDQRERQSSDLSRYRGGDAIVISATTLVIALLVVLLIVLLT